MKKESKMIFIQIPGEGNMPILWHQQFNGEIRIQTANYKLKSLKNQNFIQKTKFQTKNPISFQKYFKEFKNSNFIWIKKNFKMSITKRFCVF